MAERIDLSHKHGITQLARQDTGHKKASGKACQGNSAIPCKPVSSAIPNMMFMFCTA